MSSEVSTTKQSTNRRKIVAGLAALGIGMAGYGVYATSLTVAGTSGSSLQAGGDAALEVVATCDTTGGVTVTEDTEDGGLNTGTGYVGAVRTGYTVAGIDAACIGKTVSLAVKLDAGNYVQLGATVLDSGSTVTFPSTTAGTIAGYSVKIA